MVCSADHDAQLPVLDRGPSDFDRAHVATVSYVWQLPELPNKNWLLRGALGGWKTNGIVSAQSGPVLTVTAGTDRSQTGVGSDRAVLPDPVNTGASGPCANVAPCVNFLNAQAFGIPALGGFGNFGKGALRGPGLFNWEMGIAKVFPIREQMNLQFRFEFFDVLNTTNFNNPTSSVSGAGFGTIRGARDPRIAQVALKLTF